LAPRDWALVKERGLMAVPLGRESAQKMKEKGIQMRL